MDGVFKDLDAYPAHIRRAVKNLNDYDPIAAECAAAGLRAAKKMHDAKNTCDSRKMMDAIGHAMDACWVVENTQNVYNARGFSVPGYAIDSVDTLATTLRSEIDNARENFGGQCVCLRSSQSRCSLHNNP